MELLTAISVIYASAITFITQNLTETIAAVSATIAYLTYKKHVDTQKEAASKNIFLALKSGAKSIRDLKNNVSLVHVGFLQQNNIDQWQSNKNHILHHLSTEDIELLDHYFARLEIIRMIIVKNIEYRDDAQKQRAIRVQDYLLEMQSKFCMSQNTHESLEEEKRQFLEIVHNETYWYEPTHLSAEAIKSEVYKIPEIIGTTTYQKLKELAKIK